MPFHWKTSYCIPLFRTMLLIHSALNVITLTPLCSWSLQQSHFNGEQFFDRSQISNICTHMLLSWIYILFHNLLMTIFWIMQHDHIGEDLLIQTFPLKSIGLFLWGSALHVRAHSNWCSMVWSMPYLYCCQKYFCELIKYVEIVMLPLSKMEIPFDGEMSRFITVIQTL